MCRLHVASLSPSVGLPILSLSSVFIHAHECTTRKASLGLALSLNQCNHHLPEPEPACIARSSHHKAERLLPAALAAVFHVYVHHVHCICTHEYSVSTASFVHAFVEAIKSSRASACWPR
jgi:hypothetical protein